MTDEDIDQFLTILVHSCVVVPGYVHAHGAVPADPDDEKVIAAAIESKAAYVISEDKHLLDLKEHEGIKIMNRDQFEQELDKLNVPRQKTV